MDANVLHRGPYSALELDLAAQLGWVVFAYCGASRVPLRPPWPDGAVQCPQCFPPTEVPE